MTNADRMIALISEACKEALGDAWERMSDTEKHDTVMQVIFTAAKAGYFEEGKK